MTPYEKARQLYIDWQMPRTFEEDCRAFLQNGCLVSFPTYFAMAKPIILGSPLSAIDDPWHQFNPALCDAWFVYLFAGDTKAALQNFPYPLEHVAWSRRGGPLRIHKFNTILSK